MLATYLKNLVSTKNVIAAHQRDLVKYKESEKTVLQSIVEYEDNLKNLLNNLKFMKQGDQIIKLDEFAKIKESTEFVKEHLKQLELDLLGTRRVIATATRELAEKMKMQEQLKKEVNRYGKLIPFKDADE